MGQQEIAKTQWKPFFDAISKATRASQIEIELAGLDIGDQIAEEWTQFEGFSYDPKDDVLFVHTPILDHAIRRPQAIVADIDGSLTRSISLKDADDRVQIIRFRSPSMLKTGDRAAG
jgi:hypothetical protein